MREQREISETGDQIFYVKVSLGPSIAGQRHGIKKIVLCLEYYRKILKNPEICCFLHFKRTVTRDLKVVQKFHA